MIISNLFHVHFLPIDYDALSAGVGTHSVSEEVDEVHTSDGGAKSGDGVAESTRRVVVGFGGRERTRRGVPEEVSVHTLR